MAVFRTRVASCFRSPDQSSGTTCLRPRARFHGESELRLANQQCLTNCERVVARRGIRTDDLHEHAGHRRENGERNQRFEQRETVLLGSQAYGTLLINPVAASISSRACRFPRATVTPPPSALPSA